MNRRRRRFAAYLGAFVGVVTLYTAAYVVGMAVFEGERRTPIEALLVVVETFTTTGYGEDANAWDSPVLIVLVILMQFTGVLFIFMALPLFVVNWLEDRLTTRPPTAIDTLTDHVVICSFSERNTMLVEELEAAEVPYVIVERDRETAATLVEDGYTVIHGDPEYEETLENARLPAASALVADLDDETNASVVLAADDLCSGLDVTVITFAEDPDLAAYHRYAGADQVLSPRQLVAESLASKVTAAASADVGDAIEIDGDFEIAEMPVQSGSELAGVTIGDSGIRERTGANVVGAWFRGEFRTPPPPDATIDERTILLVAGRAAELEALKRLTLTERRNRRHGPVVVCGYGEVGSTIAKRVRNAGLDCHIIDATERPGVDTVGDVTDEETLERAGVSDASTVFLALSDDTDMVFSTLVLQQFDTDVEVIARANSTESVRNLYRAGADYVLALATVSGRMLASTVLEEDVISYDQQVEIVRTPVGELAGQTVGGADIRARTGCTVLAIERDGEIYTEFGPDFRFEPDDEVVVAGPDANVSEFTDLLT